MIISRSVIQSINLYDLLILYSLIILLSYFIKVDKVGRSCPCVRVYVCTLSQELLNKSTAL